MTHDHKSENILKSKSTDKILGNSTVTWKIIT